MSARDNSFYISHLSDWTDANKKNENDLELLQAMVEVVDISDWRELSFIFIEKKLLRELQQVNFIVRQNLT